MQPLTLLVCQFDPSDTGQHGDRPQAETHLAGLQSVRLVIADVAHDAVPLRVYIANDLGVVNRTGFSAGHFV